MSFSLVRAVAVTSDNLTSNVPEAMPAGWDGMASYDTGDAVALITGTVGEVYESRIDANAGNDPASSPDEWQHVATVYAAWASGTTYAADAWVTRNGKLWRSLEAGNLNHPPESNAAKWQDRGASNRMAMVDQKTGTLTSRYGPMTFSVAATGRVDVVGLLNINAAFATVAMQVDGNEVFSDTASLTSTSGISNWHRWLFEPLVRKRKHTVTGLPNYANPTIIVTLHGDEVVSLGKFAAGHARFIGYIEWGGEDGGTDFSTKERDEYGNWYIVERGFSDNGQLSIVIPASDHRAIKDLLNDYRARPTLYIAHRHFGVDSFFGIPTDWKLRAKNTAESDLQFRYEGM